MRGSFRWLTVLFLVALVVQFFLAGLGVFGAESFEAHRTLGYALQGGAIILLLLALVGRLGRSVVWPIALLVVLAIVQSLLAAAKDDARYLAALHVVNALAIVVLAQLVAYRAWRQGGGVSR